MATIGVKGLRDFSAQNQAHISSLVRNLTLYTMAERSGAVDDEKRIAVNALPSIPVKQVNITHMHTL